MSAEQLRTVLRSQLALVDSLQDEMLKMQSSEVETNREVRDLRQKLFRQISFKQMRRSIIGTRPVLRRRDSIVNNSSMHGSHTIKASPSNKRRHSDSDAPSDTVGTLSASGTSTGQHNAEREPRLRSTTTQSPIVRSSPSNVPKPIVSHGDDIKLPPPLFGDRTNAADGPDPSSAIDRVRIWVGSWNMGAKPFRIEQRAEISKVVPLGYHMYVFGIQEGVGVELFEYLDYYLRSVGVHRIPSDVRVEGRGDGSFVHPKYTGIAVYVSREIESDVRLIDTAAISLGISQGSKGAALMAFRIYDSTIAFLTAHLSASKPEDRKENYRHIVDEAGRAIGDANFQLLEQFHHVVFFGDLNYRTRGLDASHVLRFIKQ
jgi:Endonuclease/Exonuclease/phosphatase family 2